MLERQIAARPILPTSGGIFSTRAPSSGFREYVASRLKTVEGLTLPGAIETATRSISGSIWSLVPNENFKNRCTRR
jgi:hypothetical protein